MAETKRTPAWRFDTTDRNDPRIAELKAEVRAWNEENRGKEVASMYGVGTRWGENRYHIRRRVSVKGRVGKDNPNASKIDKWAKRDGSIPLDLAGYFGVYVNEVREYVPQAPAAPRPKNIGNFHADFSEALTQLISDWEVKAELTAEYGVLPWQEVARVVDRVLLAKLSARR